MSTISAGTGTNTAAVITPDTTGTLVFQTNGTTTALTLDASQKATFPVDASIHGLTVGLGGGSATQSSAVGYQALLNQTGAGDYNTAFGYYAGGSITTGTANTALGRQALGGSAGVTGTHNVAIGNASQYGTTSGNYNVSVGDAALYANTTGANNTAQGYQALNNNTTASNNTAVGYQAGYSNTTGAEVTFVGNQAGKGNTTGTWNIALGSYALNTNSVGTANTGIGYSALQYNTGSSNTALGYQALVTNTTGSNHTAVGYQAGYSQSTNSYMTLLGFQAGYACTANSLVAIGYQAANNITTGGNGIYIGTGVAGSSATATSELVISVNGGSGKGSTTGYINPNGGGVYQGNNSASWSTTSDVRIKENVIPIPSGLSVLGQLNPVTFDYILTKKSDVGFIAQEFQKVLPDQVQEHAASPEEKTLTGSDTLFGINPNLVPYLVKAIQELSAEITALKAQLHAANVTGF